MSMAAIDYTALADELDGADSGPTVAQQQRDSKMLDLMEKLLTSQPAQQNQPVIHVAAPNIDVPPAQVVVQPSPAPARCAWRFEFERNEDGTIKSITANPIEE